MHGNEITGLSEILLQQRSTGVKRFGNATPRSIGRRLPLVGRLAITCFATVFLGGCGSGLWHSSITALRFLPGTVDFGDVVLGQAVQSSLEVVNDSATPLLIGKMNLDAAAFSLTGDEALPFSIAPHATHTLLVGFQPLTSVDYAGQLTLMDAGARPMAQIPLRGSGHSRRLQLSATSLALTNVPLNSSAVQTLTLTSTGSASVTISSIAISGKYFNLSSVALPVTLAPLATLTIQVKFAPLTAGTSAGAITIQSNASSAPVSVSLSGVSSVGPPLAVSPVLGVSATALNFRNLPLKSSETQVLSLTSVGSSPVTISSASITGSGFSVSGTVFPLTLQPSQSQALNVTFQPTTAGAITGNIVIRSDSVKGNSTLVAVTGTGVAAQNAALSVNPLSVNFGTVTVGSPSNQTVTLTSTGSSPVTVSSSATTGPGFALVGGSFPIVLNPAQIAVLQLRFTPTASGTATGTLSIASDSTQGSSTAVALSGAGAAVAHEADLSWNAPVTSPDPVQGYNIYRIATTGESSLINPKPNISTSYVDNSVQSGAAYQYLVKSVDASGIESGPSNQFAVQIP